MAPVSGILSTPETSAKTVGVAAGGTAVGVGGAAVGDSGDGVGDRVSDGDGLGVGVSVGIGLGVGLGGGTTIAGGVGTGVALAAILPKPRSGNIRSKTWPHVTSATAATSTTSRVSTCDFFIRNLLGNQPPLRPVSLLAPWELSS